MVGIVELGDRDKRTSLLEGAIFLGWKVAPAQDLYLALVTEFDVRFRWSRQCR